MITIRVAIMGAGLSGLACAITLEKHGINPEIYEKRSQPGDRFVNGEIFLSLLHRPIVNAFNFFSREYGIHLLPVNRIERLIIISEREKAVIEGELGFTNLRGRHKDSLENQLARQVENPINFHSAKSYQELKNTYKYVIMATGDAAYAEKVDNYRRDLTVTLKGATVEGEFQPGTVTAWLDYRLAPGGYCYLIPFSRQEANLVIGFPDYSGRREIDCEKLWGRFVQRASSDLDQEFKVTDQFEVNDYILGICRQPRIGNTYFTGNCFGAVMPFMGFGQFAAIMTGIKAAEDICGQRKYDRAVAPLQASYRNSLALRRFLESRNNRELDRIVSSLQGKIGSVLLQARRGDPLRIISYLIRLWPG